MEDKKLENEVMSDAELDNVAGGTYVDSFNVASFMYQAGFNNTLNDKGIVNFAGLRSALDSIGISVEDHGGMAALGAQGNVYTNKATGAKMDQAGMMNFLRSKYPGVRYKEIVEPQSISDILGMIK